MAYPSSTTYPGASLYPGTTSSAAGAITLADNAPASDALTSTYSSVASLSDTASASDSLTSSLYASSEVTLADAASASDSPAASLTSSGSIVLADTAAASDGLTASLYASEIVLADTAAASDGLTASSLASIPLANSASASDALASSLYTPPLRSVLNPLQVSSPATISFDGAEDTVTPAAHAGPSGANDVWLRIVSGINATLALTWSGPAVGLEVWDAPPDAATTDVGTLGFQAVSTIGTLSADIGAGSAVYVRVYPLSTADNTGSGTLSWTLTVRETRQIGLRGDAILYDPPARLVVDVVSATDSGNLEFEIDGTLVSQAIADESGLLIDWGILVTANVLPGSHSLLVRDVTTGQVDQISFQVIVRTGDGVTVTPAPSSPGISASAEPVIRWIVLGIAAGATPYVFPNNPSQMDSPHPRRQITSEYTSHPGGQPIMFEGASIAATWNVEGVAFDQAHYDALEGFLAANARYWVVDHLQRAWMCSFESIDWSELKDRSRPWAHRYRMRLNIYEGPVELT